jgi:hypothetical protein
MQSKLFQRVFEKKVFYAIFSNKKKDRRFESCNQSKTPEQVSQEATFQNGHSVKSAKSCSKRRLGVHSRSESCLLSYSDIQKNIENFSDFALKVKFTSSKLYVLVQLCPPGYLQK